jgi:hypothetical protein
MPFSVDKRLVGTLCSTLVLLGCANKITYLPAGTTYGEITVSKPRVSSRERLINDRLEEEAWLKHQLADTDNLVFGTQGSSDIRAFSGTTLRAGVQADSSAIGLYRETKSQQIEDLKRQKALDEIDYQITLAKKQKELSDAQANPGAITTSPYAQTSQTPQTPASAPKITTDVQKELQTMTVSLDSLSQKLSALTGRGTGTEPAKTTATASPIDTFRDRLAYREEIRSELISNALDDAHDLGNNTLYRLSFDATVFPGSDTSAWAVVGVQVLLPRSEDSSNLMPPGMISSTRFAKIANDRIVEQAIEYGTQIQRECAKKAIPECMAELRPDTLLNLVKLTQAAARSDGLTAAATPVAPVAPKQPEKFTLEKANRLAPFFSAISGSSNFFQRSSPKGPPTKFLSEGRLDDLVQDLHRRGGEPNAKATAESIAAGAYLAALTGLQYQVASENDVVPMGDACTLNPAKRLHGFKIDPGTGVAIFDPDMAELTTIREHHFLDAFSERELFIKGEDSINQGECFKRLKSTLKKRVKQTIDSDGSNQVYAYGATPKETVQRVSEVMARRNTSEFALAAQAVTGAASIDTMFSYIRANDALFHALRRQPLAVGFSGSLSPLGQVGPASFGWILGPKYEIRYDGKSQSAGFRHAPMQNSLAGIISVPAAFEFINLRVTRCWKGTAEIWGYGTAGPCQPSGDLVKVNLPVDGKRVFQLDPVTIAGQHHIQIAPDSPKSYRVKVGEPTSLVIRGEHLWRNTTVLLGSQEADAVKVLPDMRGILATFNKVRPPSASGADPSAGMELRVITSEQSVVAGTVLIEGADAEAAPRWSLSGLPLIYPGSTLGFQASPRLPSSFADLTTTLNNFERQKSANITKFDVSTSTNRIEVLVPTSMDGWRLGDSTQILLSTKRVPNDVAPVTQVLGKVIYYDKEESSKAIYSVTTANETSLTLSLTMPVSFKEAYPAMAKLKSVAVHARWDDKGEKKSIEGQCTPAGKDGRVCAVAFAAPAGTGYTVVIGDGPDGGYPPALMKAK